MSYAFPTFFRQFKLQNRMPKYNYQNNSSNDEDNVKCSLISPFDQTLTCVFYYYFIISNNSIRIHYPVKIKIN